MHVTSCTTVEGDHGRATTVHASRADAVAALRTTYRFDDLDVLETYDGPVWSQEDLDNLDDTAFLDALDFAGITVDLDEHELAVTA